MKTPPHTDFLRAVVSNDGDIKRSTWRHRRQPTIAIQQSHYLIGHGTLPDRFRVLHNGEIVSVHRSLSAAVKRATILKGRYYADHPIG